MKRLCLCAFLASLLIFSCTNDPKEENPSSSSSSDEISSLQSSSDFDSSSSEADELSSSSSEIATSSSSSAKASSSSKSVSSSSVSSSSMSSSSMSSSSVSSSSVSSSSLSSSSVVASSSGSLSYGTRFDPEMLGLTPGATTASVNLNWISTSANCSSSSTDDGKTLVRLFNASGSLVDTFTGKTAKGPTGKCAHKATITGLTSNTNYKYSVSNNGTDWSYDYNYKVPPSGNAFTFALVADPQVTTGAQDNNTSPKASPSTTGQGWKDIVKKIAEKDAAFIASAGDQVDGGITYKPEEYEVFFAPEELRSIPFAPVIGNHDLHSQYFQHFNMPNLASTSTNLLSDGVAGNYYYLYNNILFVGLNTGFSAQAGITLKQAQTSVTEFEKVIKTAKAAHSGYDWLIVQHHKSTTSISAHSCDQDVGFLIEAGLEKLMTDQGVDLVLAGHDHVHARSHLMKWDATKSYSVRSTDKGTVYLTLTTASGVKYYPPFYILEDGTTNAGPYTEKYPVLVDGTSGVTEFRKATNNSFGGTVNENKIPLSLDKYIAASRTNYFPNYTPNYTIFEVNGKTIKATTRTSEDKVVDEFTITPKGGH